MLDEGSEFREGYAEIGDVRLHYVEAGEGPLIVLLHGFPEFWYGWWEHIKPLVAAGFRVVAPDLRGYNLSSRPVGVASYDTERLAADVRGLVHERGAESALLVGHDWGGTVAWATAMNHPEVVDRLVILNAAHPRRLLRGLRTPRQPPEVLVFLLLPATSLWVPETLHTLCDLLILVDQSTKPVVSSDVSDLLRGVVGSGRRGAA